MATNTYIALDKKTITSNVSSVDFTGISAGYTDLVIVANVGSTVAEDYLQLRFNSDSATNYSTISIDGNGSTTRAGKSADRNAMFAQWNIATANEITANLIINVQNYASTNIYKTVVVRSNRATATTPTYTGTEGLIGVWRKSPEAITTVTCLMATGSIVAGSTLSLYGIRAEGVSPAPKATGGAVYDDELYYYHAFGASGAFVPTQSITADILVVAGGGQGGGGNGGGGGAGGLLAFASQALSATSYNVTVGAGGSGGGTNAAGGSGVNSQFGALTAAVGGGGGGGYSAGAALSGGSGGGGGTAGNTTAGAASPAGQGNAGGAGHPTDNMAGGGGGAGAAGGAGTVTVTGVGGNGSSAYSAWGIATGAGQNVSGTYYFAGGGSAGGDAASGNAIVGAAGFGGGGTGGSEPTNATAGAANTGGGGGGEGGGGAGANGGSGVVIIRYLKA
jgi:hypothetical protein